MTITNSFVYAERMSGIPESFIREILKVSTQPGMISFAGGLPNPNFFPVEKMMAAAEKVLHTDGKSVLQYAPTEGYLPLRDYIAQRQSAKENCSIKAEDVLILNGAQQGLDLVGKLFIDKHKPILLEAPSYLGAIQAFSVFEPTIHAIEITPGGPDIDSFAAQITRKHPSFFYCIPNFQNPTGNMYDVEHRRGVVNAINNTNTLIVEDDPYGEIIFQDDMLPSLHAMNPDAVVYLGSFSKIISPGLRLGWAVANKEIVKRMSIAKQASDLHSNNFAQRVLYQFLIDNQIESHMKAIREFYKSQAEMMMDLIEMNFPDSCSYIAPKGGMFIWVTLPEEIKTSLLLRKAAEHKVLFVPGQYFFSEKGAGENTMRLNFSNPTSGEMTRGIKILGELINEMMAEKKE